MIEIVLEDVSEKQIECPKKNNADTTVARRYNTIPILKSDERCCRKGLRKKILPITNHLNEWRLNQYSEKFPLNFLFLKHYPAMCEGKYILKQNIHNQLLNYTIEKLTSSA